MKDESDMDYGIWDSMDEDEKAEWEKDSPDPLRAQFWIKKQDIPKTDLLLFQANGGCGADNEGWMLEYLNEHSGNTSGIAKITFDLNIWELCEVEFNDGERYKCSYQRIGDGYDLGEKLKP